MLSAVLSSAIGSHRLKLPVGSPPGPALKLAAPEVLATWFPCASNARKVIVTNDAYRNEMRRTGLAKVMSRELPVPVEPPSQNAIVDGDGSKAKLPVPPASASMMPSQLGEAMPSNSGIGARLPTPSKSI